MAKLTIKGHPQLELNRVGFLRDGRVEAQCALDSNGKDVPNGTIVGVVAHERKVYPFGAVGDKPHTLGIVYTSERNLDLVAPGLKDFTNKDGDFVKVGLFSKGDTFTTNNLSWTDAFEGEEAALKALGEYAKTPVFVVPAEDGSFELKKEATPGAELEGVVSKWYTMPNGQPGAEITIVGGNL